ncbi:DUF5304 domain-containing protein [Streptomyces sp. LE64]|uniref:DUF5304 domain-containing protein n=1 Tax=unclassified Streptomyces TaxID=2593676 RepID=UPI00331E6797
MSEAERPAPGPDGPAGGPDAPDDDAWSTACAEDLAAERDRRRARYGPQTGSAAEELRKLVDAVADKLSDLPGPLLGPAASGVVRQAVKQAREAVEPVIERNPDVFDHLAAAGGELLAAYRSAVSAQETRWTRGDAPSPSTPPEAEDPRDQQDPPDEGPARGGRIDLD